MLLCWQFAKWNAYFRIDGAIWCVWNAIWWYSMCEKWEIGFPDTESFRYVEKMRIFKDGLKYLPMSILIFWSLTTPTSASCFTCFTFSGAEFYFVKINSTCRVVLWNLGLILQFNASWKVTFTEPTYKWMS